MGALTDFQGRVYYDGQSFRATRDVVQRFRLGDSRRFLRLIIRGSHPLVSYSG